MLEPVCDPQDGTWTANLVARTRDIYIVQAMEPDADLTITAVDELIERYRNRCLWFLRSDYRPVTREERLRMLEYIERHGDLEAHRDAGRLKRWLSRTSSEPSAA